MGAMTSLELAGLPLSETRCCDSTTQLTLAKSDYNTCVRYLELTFSQAEKCWNSTTHPALTKNTDSATLFSKYQEQNM